MNAMLEIPMPGSCRECHLAYNETACDVEKHGCGYGNFDVTGYAETRHPGCPLKAVVEIERMEDTHLEGDRCNREKQ